MPRRILQVRGRPPAIFGAFLLAAGSMLMALSGCGDLPGTAHGNSAMVVSAHGLASAIGKDVLLAGGNAVDAAVAVGYALAVVYPEAGNIGGGGFMLVYNPGSDQPAAVIDFRETAPAAAHAGMYAGLEDASVDGPLAAAVPGTVAGFQLALDRFGTKSRPELMNPSIDLARNGFEVDEGLEEELAGYRESLLRHVSTAGIFFPEGLPLSAGSKFHQPDLAAVLERIRDSGNAGFYSGRTAELIASSQRTGGGLITRGDLASYAAVVRKAQLGSYRGHEIVSVALPSSGGPCLAAMLRMLEPYDLAGAGHNTPRSIHLIAETMKRAFSVRAGRFGDPEFTRIPVDSIIAGCTLDIDPDVPIVPTPSAMLAGYPWPDDPLPGAGAAGSEGTETTHFAVIDARGMVAAVTYTINDLFGNKEVVAGAGFFLNDEMDDFVTIPGRANIFGLTGSEANHVGPGRRPLSSMSPTIVLRDGKPILIAGARGGPRIISAVLQVMLNVVDYRMPAGEAVAAPRFHHQWSPDEIVFESNGFDPEALDLLTKAGYSIRESDGTVGQLQVIRIEGDDIIGIPDPREGGEAAGY